jgi:hypothetical protein
VAELRERALIDLTVTAGHAFGGDLEAVGVPSALQLAHHVGGADVIICGMGPGVVGTNSRYGHTGVDAAWAIQATRALSGTPVLCVRASDGDGRDRHRGISHHTATVLSLVGDVGVAVPPIPAGIEAIPGAEVVDVEVPDTVGLLADLDLRITTMGRGPEDDPLFFTATGASAAVAAALIERP